MNQRQILHPPPLRSSLSVPDAEATYLLLAFTGLAALEKEVAVARPIQNGLETARYVGSCYKNRYHSLSPLC